MQITFLIPATLEVVVRLQDEFCAEFCYETTNFVLRLAKKFRNKVREEKAVDLIISESEISCTCHSKMPGKTQFVKPAHDMKTQKNEFRN